METNERASIDSASRATEGAGLARLPAATASTDSTPPPQELVQASRSTHPLGLLLSIVVVVATAAFVVSYFVRGTTHPSTSDAYVEGRIVRISPKVSGQVIALHVDDNSTVTAGDTLLEIDPADYQARVDQARAATAIAESSIQQADAAIVRAEASIGEAEAAVGSADADSKRRASDYRRYLAMGTDGVSAQQLEAAKTAAEVGDRQKQSAEMKLAAAHADHNVAGANAVSARAQLAAARAQLLFAELQLEYTRIVAPEAGLVTKKNVEVGSFVSAAQPLLAIVPVDYWAIANFKEIQLERIRIGQSATIEVDAFSDMHLTGRVESIQAGTGSRFQLLPPENATGNWVKVVQRVPVKIIFDRGQQALERLVPGMSLEVSVDTRDSSAAALAPTSGPEGR